MNRLNVVILLIAFATATFAQDEDSKVEVSSEEYKRLILLESEFDKYKENVAKEDQRQSIELENKSEQLRKILGQITDLNEQIGDKNKDQKDIELDASNKTEEIKSLKEEKESLKDQLDDALSSKSKIEEKYRKLADAEKQIADLTKARDELQSKVDEQIIAAENSKTEITRLQLIEKDHEQSSKDLAASKKSNKKLEKELGEKTATITQQSTELGNMRPIKEQLLKKLYSEIITFTNGSNFNYSSKIQEYKNQLASYNSIANDDLRLAESRLNTFQNFATQLSAANDVLNRHYVHNDVEREKGNLTQLINNAVGFDGIVAGAKSTKQKLSSYCAKHDELRTYLTLIINRQKSNGNKTKFYNEAKKVVEGYPYLDTELENQKQQRFNGDPKLSDVSKICG